MKLIRKLKFLFLGTAGLFAGSGVVFGVSKDKSASDDAGKSKAESNTAVKMQPVIEHLDPLGLNGGEPPNLSGRCPGGGPGNG